MKRQISVSFLLAIFVLFLAWIYIKHNNETREEDAQIATENEISKEDAITINQDYVTYPYFIKSEHGRLVVYESKNDSIYMETGIETRSLPIEIQDKIESCLFFRSEAELYDFLESYSS